MIRGSDLDRSSLAKVLIRLNQYPHSISSIFLSNNTTPLWNSFLLHRFHSSGFKIALRSIDSHLCSIKGMTLLSFIALLKILELLETRGFRMWELKTDTFQNTINRNPDNHLAEMKPRSSLSQQWKPVPLCRLMFLTKLQAVFQMKWRSSQRNTEHDA